MILPLTLALTCPVNIKSIGHQLSIFPDSLKREYVPDFHGYIRSFPVARSDFSAFVPDVPGFPRNNASPTESWPLSMCIVYYWPTSIEEVILSNTKYQDYGPIPNNGFVDAY